MIYHSKIYAYDIYSKLVEIQNKITSSMKSDFRLFPYFHASIQTQYEDLLHDLKNIDSLINKEEIISKIEKHYKYFFVKKELLNSVTKRTRVINNMSRFIIEIKNDLVYSFLEENIVYNYNNKYDCEKFVISRLNDIYDCFNQVNDGVAHYKLVYPNPVCIGISRIVSYYLNRISIISGNLLSLSRYEEYKADYKKFFEKVFVSLRNIDLDDLRVTKEVEKRIKLNYDNFMESYNMIRKK